MAIEIDLIGQYQYRLPVEEPAKAELDEDELDDEEFDDDDEEYDEDVPVQMATGAWLVQVKYSKKRIRQKTVRDFLAQIEAIKQQGDYTTTTCWFFAKGGFVKNAAKRLQEAGVLYSDRAQFNQLANLFDFFGLPE